MTLGKRLLNIARAEIRNAAKKVRGSADGGLGSDARDPVEERIEEEARRRKAEEDAKAEAESKQRARRPSAGKKTESIEVRVRGYYANLELPIGASSAEVKASYRRLMRRYHPDLHHDDRDKQAVATRLTQELRIAYEELIRYLGERGQ